MDVEQSALAALDEQLMDQPAAGAGDEMHDRERADHSQSKMALTDSSQSTLHENGLERPSQGVSQQPEVFFSSNHFCIYHFNYFNLGFMEGEVLLGKVLKNASHRVGSCKPKRPLKEVIFQKSLFHGNYGFLKAI